MEDNIATLVAGNHIREDDRDRPLIVCIHGGGCNAGYFDLPEYSFCAAARKRGYPLLLINRPGHGGSAGIEGGLDAMAAAIQRDVAALLERRDDPRWYLLGHSIGGAIAIIIAGELRPATLCGVAVSGIGLFPMPAALRWGGTGVLDAAPPIDILFGPPGSFSWRAPRVLRGIAEAWNGREVAETLNDWPRRVAGSAQGVSVPVHLRLAEGEHIWRTGRAEVARFAAMFTAAPKVDAALLPGGGHLYELHRNGAELIDSQLGFFDSLT